MTAGSLVVIGLGPAGLDRVSDPARAALMDAERTVVVRTLHHPAAAELAALREVVSCDDLYETAEDFDSLYGAIADRALESARSGATVYAVPGSALVGERSVALVRRQAAAADVAVTMMAGESFLDLIYDRVGIDPIATGVQVLDGRALPDPLPFHLPTVITQVDRTEVLEAVAADLRRVLPDDLPVTVLDRLGDADEKVAAVALADLDGIEASPRLSLFLDPPPVGWHGLVTINRRLRVECPWDREQTHHSLLRHLVEEAYETVEAITNLPVDDLAGGVDYGAYADLEEELGDLLLQVIFHATLAAEVGAFDVEEVAETMRRKLVYRHPHVFGDVEVAHSGEVKANWEKLKAAEKQRDSLMDDIPVSLPALARADKMQRRAASVGFDWEAALPVIAKLREEVAELEADLDHTTRRTHELGDVLFTVVNLARHLDIDAEVALRQSADSFSARFRAMEQLSAEHATPLSGMSPAELDALWERVKAGGETTSDS